MKLPPLLLEPLREQALQLTRSRPPDRVIGSDDNPYLHRWYMVPRNEDVHGNVYVHRFYRSDDDRALHDHPWDSCSIILEGRYFEHTIEAGGIHTRYLRSPGSVVHRVATDAHRIQLHDVDRAAKLYPLTLFLTGPIVREWGFHCPERGWVHWQDFTNPDDGGSTIGKGCEA